MILAKMFSRKWLLTTFLVFIGAVILVGLGNWQLDRLKQRRAFNARVESMRAAEALDLNLDVPKDIDSMEWRAVKVKGKYDFGNQVALRNQYNDDREYGYHLITPLLFDRGAVLVDRDDLVCGISVLLKKAGLIMKYSLKSSFSRLIIALFFSILLVTLFGRAVTLTGAWMDCADWPLCAPSDPSGYLKLAHLILAGIASILMIWTLRKAWRVEHEEKLLFPFPTLSGGLFFGQALIGAIEVSRAYSKHFVILHAISAISLWIFLGALVFTSGVFAKDTIQSPLFDYRQRIKDFFVLSKPLIVALLLLTTYAGLVAGTKAWPSASVTFCTLLGGALAAGGSRALNQYIDRELDKNMQRTAKRPLADRRLTAAEGLSYGLALCLTSYYIMAGGFKFLFFFLSIVGVFFFLYFFLFIF